MRWVLDACSILLMIPALVEGEDLPHIYILLGGCRTLWGKREQAKHCGIELLCTYSIVMLGE